MKSVFEELQSGLASLLCKRRSGVAAALVAASARTATCQRELCAVLAAAFQSLASSNYSSAAAAAATSTSGGAATNSSTSPLLAAAVLSLDSYAQFHCTLPAAPEDGEQAQHAGLTAKLSPAGCAMMIALMKFPQGACRPFTDSLLALPPADLQRAGRDPGGSRVLESLLSGTAPDRVKQALLAKLKVSFA